MHHAIFRKRGSMRRDGCFSPTARNWMPVRYGVVMRRGKIRRGDHRDDILGGLRRGNIDTRDPCKGVRRTHKNCSERAVRPDVIAEAALPSQKRIVLDPTGPGVGNGGGLRHAVLRPDKTQSLRSVMPALAYRELMWAFTSGSVLSCAGACAQPTLARA